jgi:hypothetical protein
MLPEVIMGHVPDTAGITGPLPLVMTVIGPPSSWEPDPDPLPELEPVLEEPGPDEPVPEEEPALDELPPDDVEPEGVPLELPEPLDVPSPEAVAPVPEPLPKPPVEEPFAHQTAVDALRHARAVHRPFVIELTLQSRHPRPRSHCAVGPGQWRSRFLFAIAPRSRNTIARPQDADGP